MARIISFASGCVHTWSKDRNGASLLDYLRKLKIDGVEITFGSKEGLYDFELLKNSEKWLKKLKYVSIHSPFGLTRDAVNEEEVIKQLSIIDKLYKKIRAKNVIIHPQELPSAKVLQRFDFKVSTENLPRKSGYTILKLKKILNKYPKIGLCLDVAHSYHWSRHETSKLIKAFEKRITQVHFSGTYKGKSHQSLRTVSKDFLFSIEPVIKLKVPIVIEENIKIKSEKFLAEEIEFIRGMFS
jgi:sugar phosphate isomerase/epimerase